ncbi:MAG: hypothetical protein OXH64_11030 [Rhodospirillaceae bacterium]|nr:hypothetical protein [Rhodospirillaceae bacterium]
MIPDAAGWRVPPRSQWPRFRSDSWLTLAGWAWLHVHYGEGTVKETCRKYAQRFGVRPTVVQMREANKAYRFGLAKRQPTVNAGCFRKGHRRNPELPLYAERWRTRKGKRTLMIKLPGPSPWPVHEKMGWSRDAHWQRKAVAVFECLYGPAPEGHAVVQIDGDPAHCCPGNLAAVPRGALGIMNARWTPGYPGPEANPARVRLAELRLAMGKARNSPPTPAGRGPTAARAAGVGTSCPPPGTAACAADSAA